MDNKMDGIRSEEKCPCMKCIYLIQAIRKNERLNGRFDLQIHCGISGCPSGVIPDKYKQPTKKLAEARSKINACVEMLQRCIEQKSIGSDAFE